jgi:hemophore-related protein
VYRQLGYLIPYAGSDCRAGNRAGAIRGRRLQLQRRQHPVLQHRHRAGRIRSGAGLRSVSVQQRRPAVHLLRRLGSTDLHRSSSDQACPTGWGRRRCRPRLRSGQTRSGVAAASVERSITPTQGSPTMTNVTTRQGRCAIVGAIGAGAALFALAAPALADPPPNCTAGDRAQVAAGVSAGMSAYLFTHPDINTFFTGLKGQPVDEIRGDVSDLPRRKHAGEGRTASYPSAARRFPGPLRHRPGRNLGTHSRGFAETV